MSEQTRLLEPPFTEDEARALIAAAQAYDLEHKPWGAWRRVPDDQVWRLISGAIMAIGEAALHE